MTPHRDTINRQNEAADRSRELHATAAAIDLQDVGAWIRTARAAKMRGKTELHATACRQYLKFLFMYSNICEIAARNGWKDPVFQPQQPIPIREQLVGLSAEDRRALEWKPYSEEFSHA